MTPAREPAVNPYRYRVAGLLARYTLEDAKAIAARIFARTGIVVSIEEVKS